MSSPPDGTRVRVLLVALPALLALALALSTGGLWVASMVGRPARGEAASISVTSGCAEAWEPVLRTRAEGMGIGDLVVERRGGVVVVRGVLPGLEDDAVAVPRVLTAPGELSVRLDGQASPVATRADLVAARLTLDVRGHAYVGLELTDLARSRLRALPPDGRLVAELDGELIPIGPVDEWVPKEELWLQPKVRTTAEELRKAADWHLALSAGPAPCPVQAVAVDPA